jgi:hypothetical protein
VRIVDNGRPEVWDKSDAAFTILPVPQITITSPVSGDIWRVGDSRDITWSDNGGLISNNLTLEYSTDTGTTWSNIATGVANSKSYTWKVADAVSATCKIRIQDPSRTPATTALSEDTFRIADPLITITAPKGGEKWAVNDIAPVTWTTEGSVSDNLILKYSPDGGSTYYPAKDSDGNIAINVANSGLFYWLVPDNVSSNVIFRIEDGDRPVTFDTSDTTFSIIEVPRFVNIGIGPAGSAKEFVLGDTVDITWKCEGLSISDNLIIDSSNDNFVSSRSVIATGVPNTGKYTWTIPQDALTGSTLKVRITDGNRTAITGKYDGYFRIRGGFTLTSPNGGEHWVSKSPHTITWSTRGNIPRVKLEYTTNDGVSWNSIAASLENAGSYSWILPDIKSDTVKVRVSDPDDGTVADSSDVDFGVNYVTVKFNVLDFDTLQHLSDLSVSEPATGWVDTGVDSAIIRELVYPYGTYTTFFTKTNYIDNSVTWSPPKEGLDPYVITVYLENSASAQVTWEAILSYSYSPADDILSCVGSLQRKGKLVGLREDERARMGGATFTIYEPDGATIRKVLVASVPNSSGMYTFTYASTDFLSGKVYPATLSITYNEQSYTSTANIDVGAEKLQYEFFTKTAEKLTTSVQAIEEAVAGGTAQTKRDIESAKSDITNSLNSTISDTKTDIESKIENVLQKTDLAMKSEILNNESTIRAGDIMVIRYRTYSGLRPVVDIYNPNNAQVISRALMTEIGSTGIYEYSVRFLRTWGKGPCSVVCSESTKGSLDAMTVEMIDSDMDSISSQVSSILGSTSSISNLKKVADSMSSQFNMLESALSKIGKDMVSQVKKSTGSSEQFNTVFSQLSSMSKQLKAMTGSSGVNLEKLYNVASEKKSDMVYLKNKTQELKAAMEINQKLVDSIAHKTVTQTWYEYR